MNITPGSVRRVVLVFFIFNSLIYNSLAQNGHDINLELIHQKQVRNYITEKNINKLDNYSSIKPSWKRNTDESEFQTHEKVFYVDDNLNEVWHCYKMANPVESWNGHFVKFALLISKQTNTVTYSDGADFEKVDTGQVYFLDLKILKGIMNVPVAFEITNIDTINKIIEFSYIDGNKSEGKQVIQFIDNGNGSTKIVHKSYFKSDSHFRDNYFYPYFHTKIIKDFHRNMRHMINRMFKSNQK